MTAQTEQPVHKGKPAPTTKVGPTPEPREGFTTGSAVAAAAAGALAALLTGETPETISIPLPPDENGVIPPERLSIPLSFCERLWENGVAIGYAGVIKDAGDDPDVTNGMLFTVHAARDAAHVPAHLRAETAPALPLGNGITLHAGRGIGLVTLPGLPVAVGEMAVNPAPRRQIAAALLEVAGLWGYHGAMHCRIAALDGEERAGKTLNPRLGVTGGISILGTRGTVRPFSAEAWETTISRALDVAATFGVTTACLTTGRRSEAALRALFPDLPPQAFVQAADYAGHALAEAAGHGFSRIIWGCFPGKLLKLAQGLRWTHAHAAETDFSLFARFCAETGLPQSRIGEAVSLPTIAGALEVVREFSPDAYRDVIARMAHAALESAREMASGAGSGPEITVCAFDMRGELLTTVSGGGERA